jgi:hypothetical protein
MKHLYSFSVFQPLEELPGGGEGLKDIGCDGVELFTLYEKVPDFYKSVSPAVHLPYAIDWHSAWNGKADMRGLSEEDIRICMYGRDREEIVSNVRLAIQYASELDPAYGVLHASNVNLDEIMMRVQTDNSRELLRDFCEMMNQVVSGYKKNEPPFKLAFENLWLPGLRLVDPWEYRYIDSHIEFDNWGFCLDTGHLMNTLPDAYTESICVERLLEIFSRYPDEMKERIGTVHLHQSTTAEYRKTFKEERRPPEETVAETVTRVYSHIIMVDQHLPFSIGGCRTLVEELSPDFVTHEMIGQGPDEVIRQFRQQRSFFPM